MTLNDYKAYRAIWKPVWEIKKWREQAKRNRQAWAIRGFRTLYYQKPDAMNQDRQLFYACILSSFIILATIIVLVITWQQPAHAAEIPEQAAIKTVIGEAENQGFIGMLALSHALRNRGTLKGCYGFNSPRVRHHLYSAQVYRTAQQAWEQSAIDFDMTKGATGWGNADDLKAFAKCKWWRNCRITFMYKDHWFYRGRV